MKFQQYDSTNAFGNDVMDTLLEHEAQNNLPISFIKNEHGVDTSSWLMATVKDDVGYVLLTAACTPPFCMVLYETGNRSNDSAVKLLSDELKAINYHPYGVLAEQGLANRFAEVHVGKNNFYRYMSMNVMRLDKVGDIPKAPGHCRPLWEDDLYYVPYWERAFSEECRVEVFDIPTNVERLKKQLTNDVHYIWEDRVPVSQAVHGRSTENGAIVNGVYTPPHFRKKGYASSVVAELTRILLDRGNKFCCLFADMENPISCGIYRKLGYVDQCIFNELKFRKETEK